MNILFDTHTFLWFLEGDEALSKKAREMLLSIENRLYFSAVSYWEICIKISIGKLQLAEHWRQTIERTLTENNILWLEIKKAHLNGIVTLPWHHRDPFDRLLVAQAVEEKCVLCTADTALSSYNIETIQ